MHEANEVARELGTLQARGAAYTDRGKAWIGALLICSAASVVSVATEHVGLSQGVIVAMVLGHIVRTWQKDRFDKDWRRIEYLRGYMSAKAGERLLR